MYEGYLQHDAQEVLQCILGYIQEACDTIKKEQKLKREDNHVMEVKMENEVDVGSSSSVAESPNEEDGQVGGKRKSDTEVGNAKKKPKSVKSKKTHAEEETRNKPLTRSKRRSSSEITVDNTQNKEEEAEDEGMKKQHKEDEGESDGEGKSEKASKAEGKRKKNAKLSWLRPSGKQPSIFSKFRSVGKISCMTVKNQNKPEQENELTDGQSQNEKICEERAPQNTAGDKKAMTPQGRRILFIQSL